MATKTAKTPAAKPAKAGASRPVIVFTEHRGVFFGQSSDPLDATTAKLSDLRNCIYWTKAVGGVFGLAEKGPDSGCRIGAKVKGPLGLQKVSGIIECTPEAAAAWEAAPAVS